MENILSCNINKSRVIKYFLDSLQEDFFKSDVYKSFFQEESLMYVFLDRWMHENEFPSYDDFYSLIEREDEPEKKKIYDALGKIYESRNNSGLLKAISEGSYGIDGFIKILRDGIVDKETILNSIPPELVNIVTNHPGISASELLWIIHGIGIICPENGLKVYDKLACFVGLYWPFESSDDEELPPKREDMSEEEN